MNAAKMKELRDTQLEAMGHNLGFVRVMYQGTECIILNNNLVSIDGSIKGVTLTSEEIQSLPVVGDTSIESRLDNIATLAVAKGLPIKLVASGVMSTLITMNIDPESDEGRTLNNSMPDRIKVKDTDGSYMLRTVLGALGK